MKAWAYSLALHALAGSCLAVPWLAHRQAAPQPVSSWRVSFASASAGIPAKLLAPAAVPVPPEVLARPSNSMPVGQTPTSESPREVPAAPSVAELPRFPPATLAGPISATGAEAPRVEPAPALPVAMPSPDTRQTEPVSAALPTPHPALPEAVIRPAAPPARDEAGWRDALWQHLRALQRYPARARRLGQEGEVVLDLGLAANGSLESLALRRGSGYPMLDDDALALLRAALRAMAGEAPPGRRLHLVIPLRYELAD